jgi:hypothetical protein
MSDSPYNTKEAYQITRRRVFRFQTPTRNLGCMNLKRKTKGRPKGGGPTGPKGYQGKAQTGEPTPTE